MGTDITDQTDKSAEGAPTLIRAFAISPLSVDGGKWLARCATDQDFEGSRSKEVFQFLRRKLGYISLNKSRGVVRFESVLASGIDVDSRLNLKSFQNHSVRQRTYATEQIYNLRVFDLMGMVGNLHILSHSEYFRIEASSRAGLALVEDYEWILLGNDQSRVEERFTVPTPLGTADLELHLEYPQDGNRELTVFLND